MRSHVIARQVSIRCKSVEPAHTPPLGPPLGSGLGAMQEVTFADKAYQIVGCIDDRHAADAMSCQECSQILNGCLGCNSNHIRCHYVSRKHWSPSLQTY